MQSYCLIVSKGSFLLSFFVPTSPSKSCLLTPFGRVLDHVTSPTHCSVFGTAFFKTKSRSKTSQKNEEQKGNGHTYFKTVDETSTAVEEFIRDAEREAQATRDKVMDFRRRRSIGGLGSRGKKVTWEACKSESKVLRLHRKLVVLNEHMDDIISSAIDAITRQQLNPHTLTAFIDNLAARYQRPSKATLPLYRNYRRREGLAVYGEFRSTVFTQHEQPHPDFANSPVALCCISGELLYKNDIHVVQLIPLEFSSSIARHLFDGMDGAESILMSPANGLLMTTPCARGFQAACFFIVPRQGSMEFEVLVPYDNDFIDHNGQELQFIDDSRPRPSRACLYFAFLKEFLELKQRDDDETVEKIEKYANVNLWSLQEGDMLRLSTVAAMGAWNGWMPSEEITRVLGVPSTSGERARDELFVKDYDSLVCHYLAVWRAQKVNYFKKLRGFRWRGEEYSFWPDWENKFDNVPDDEEYELYEHPEELYALFGRTYFT